jgi:hypothetical protein
MLVNLKIKSLVFFLLYSCGSPKPLPQKRVFIFNSPLGSFSLTAPDDWKKINLEGIDSYFGRIAIDAKDSLTYSLGTYASDLHEHAPEGFEEDDSGKFEKSVVSYKTMNGYRIKILTPKKYGIGMSGVYIDSLWMDGEDKMKFDLYGTNLSKANQKVFFEIIHSLRFSNNIMMP